MPYTNFFYSDQNWRSDLYSTNSNDLHSYPQRIFEKYPPNSVLSISHMDITIEPDIFEKKLKGIANITITHKPKLLLPSEQIRSYIKLNAVDFYSVSVSGKDVLHHSYDGKFIHIYWTSPFEGEEYRNVSISWKVLRPVSGIMFQNPINSTHYLDQVAFSATENGLYRTRYWLPCIDYPGFKHTFEISIIHQADHIATANGQFSESHQLLTHKNLYMNSTKFVNNLPCSSTHITFAVGNFIKITIPGHNIPISYFTTKNKQESDLFKTFESIPNMIYWISDKLKVEFPWPKYDNVILPRYIGKTEGSSISIIPMRHLKEPGILNDIDLKVDLINISNIVGFSCVQDSWLFDGFSIYFKAIWIQDHLSTDEFHYQMYKSAKNYMDECKLYKRPLYCKEYVTASSLQDRHNFDGGCWRIHMLRSILGEELFWFSITKLLKSHKWDSINTNIFKNTLEACSGLNLTRFFDEFVYSSNYPRIKVHYQYEPISQLVQITIDQGNYINSNYERVLYSFKIEVQLIDSLDNVHKKTLEFESVSRVMAIFHLEPGVIPNYIRIDPEMSLLVGMKLEVPTHILLNMAERAEDIRSRILAYKQLISSGLPNIIEQVRVRIRKEPFYGVRIQVFSFLCIINSYESFELISELLLLEKNNLALSKISKYVSTVSGNLITKAIKTRISDPKIPQLALRGLLFSLGCQICLPNKTELLLNYMHQFKDLLQVGGSHISNGIVRQFLIKGLANTKEIDSFDYLVKCLKSNSECCFVIPTLISSITKLAISIGTVAQKNTAIDLIVTISHSEDNRVSFACIDSLIKLSAFEKINLIESIKSRRFINEDHIWIDKQVDKFFGFQPQIDDFMEYNTSTNTFNKHNLKEVASVSGITRGPRLPVADSSFNRDFSSLLATVHDLKTKIWELEFKNEQILAINSEREIYSQKIEAVPDFNYTRFTANSASKTDSRLYPGVFRHELSAEPVTINDADLEDSSSKNHRFYQKDSPSSLQISQRKNLGQKSISNSNKQSTKSPQIKIKF
ncbi:Glutamyl aminopeptidase [Smittium culicis]|uniref:Transcription initiation factor TFIID subunit 2 n=1 Tax=Smittium culicis TaxID=133412 RepID=A0A1R1XTF2_9FUNG|nr:Glutamyl aminopeptidase [Smittium culicis]